MAKPRNRLQKLVLDELSVCRKGMNQGSRILITKAEEDMPEKQKEGPVARLTKALRAALSVAATGKDETGAVVKSDEETMTLVDKHLEEAAQALDSDVTEAVAKGGGKPFDDDDDDDDDELEFGKADESYRIAKAVESAREEARAEIAKANARVEKLEKAAEREAVQKSIEGMAGSLPLNLSEVTDVLMALPATERGKFEKVLKSAEAAAKASLLTQTLGSRVVKADSAEGQLESLAKAHQATHKVSFAKAYTDVCELNPSLYAEAQRANGFSR